MLARIQKYATNDWYGKPAVRVVTGTDQAAATECTDTVPAGKLWIVLTYAVRIVGTNQTPSPKLQAKDPDAVSMGLYPVTSAAMNANLTCDLLWGVNLPLTGGGALTSNTGPIPLYGIIIPESGTIGTSTGTITNQNYGAPIITVLEYSR